MGTALPKGNMDAYTVVRKLGTGTYGSAYLVCLRGSTSTQYVLKKIRLEKVSEKERAAAEQEVQLLQDLDHAFILGYVDAFEYKQHLCIITEYCEAGDLYSYLKGRKSYLPEAQVLEWFIQIAMAVQHCHDRKVLHRDLKTQNIFLTRNGDVKLGDFGISRVLSGPMEMASTIVGTPYYMSPEILECKPYDFKSDIWSLGCVLCEMATLKHAFDAADMNGLVMKVLRGNVPSLPELYSPSLEQLISRMLSKSPRGRPTLEMILSADFLQDLYHKCATKSDQLHISKHRSRPLGMPGDEDTRSEYSRQQEDDYLNRKAAVPTASQYRNSILSRAQFGLLPCGRDSCQGWSNHNTVTPGPGASEIISQWTRQRQGRIDYAVEAAEEQLRRIQDERDSVRQRALAVDGLGIDDSADTSHEAKLAVAPTFGAEASLAQYIVGDEPTPKEASNKLQYWERYDDMNNPFHGTHRNADREQPPRRRFRSEPGEASEESIEPSWILSVDNDAAKRSIVHLGAAYHQTSGAPAEVPAGNYQQATEKAFSHDLLGPRERMAARKREEARKREGQLLAVRKKYFEERRMAEQKNREMYKQSSSVIPLAGYEEADDEFRTQRPVKSFDTGENEDVRFQFEAEIELECGAHNAQERGSKGLLPTSSFVKGQMSERVFALRKLCRDSLGEDLFHQVYSLIKANVNGDFGQNDERAIIHKASSILGRHQLHHIAFIDQLLYFESKM